MRSGVACRGLFQGGVLGGGSRRESDDVNDDELIAEIFGELPQTEWPKRRSLQSVVRERRKKVPTIDEDHFHYQVAKLLNHAIAPAGLASQDGVAWVSIENRGHKSIWEGARNKKRGVCAGFPDVLIQWAGRVFYIELKTPIGVVSPSQAEMHAALRAAGAPVAVARSLDEVVGFLRAQQIPHRAVAL